MGGASSDRLLVTTNAGQSFETALTAPLLLGFAESDDGSRVYAGGPSTGLRTASRTDLAFRKVSDVPMQCLTRSGGLLYACSNETTGSFVLGASSDDGVTFAPKLGLAGLRGPLQCAGRASGSVCASVWPSLRDRLGIGADAGGVTVVRAALMRKLPLFRRRRGALVRTGQRAQTPDRGELVVAEDR